MMTRELMALWGSAAAALGNHLWQSTVFAIAVGVLTLSLRKNQARARYWLWLAASLKFLIPFSWLEAAGARLAWARGGSAATGLSVVIEQVNQPFAGTAIARTAPSAAVIHSSFLLQGLPLILAAVWFCGFAAVLAMWGVRWRRIAAAIRQSAPTGEGREVEALQRLKAGMGIRPRVEMRISETMLEPGIFGIVRPVLIWPRGISECLDDGHLEAVLAHELWHVRRRDNLAAALHMVVEAAFWFHPLVWWLGARLVDERERACDEQVLELGSKRNVYAESILKVCQFCVGSPLACVSGVTGSDLKKRMVHIMSEGMVRKLDFGRKILLTAAALVTLAAPMTIGLLTATPSRAQAQGEDTAPGAKFDSVSIKPSVINTPTYAGGNVHTVRMMFSPNGFVAANVTLRVLIQEAYGVQADQLIGGPDWLSTDAYDFEARRPQSDGDQNGFVDKGMMDKRAAENRVLLQGVLADRAKLVLHQETKVLPVYALVVGEAGSKLQPSLAGNSVNSQHRMRMKVDQEQVKGISAEGVSMTEIVRQLSMQLGRSVVDKTGLKGTYDFNLHWTAEPAVSAGENGPLVTSKAPPDPSFFTALEEQLGLKLEPQKQPMPVLVIDHVEKPVDEQSLVTRPVSVSEGEMAALILKKVAPVYPELALQAHIEGTVVLDAIVGKAGDIENLTIVSGPPLLAPAAIDAVKHWKYQPYLQQGEPVEVATHLHVSFPFSE